MSGLQIVRRGDEPPDVWTKALFLAGPSGPGPGDTTWRETAVSMLKERGFEGVVFLDENGPASESSTPTQSARWAAYWRARADCVLLWFPPASSGTTLELARLGEWSDTGRIVLGVDDDAFDGAAELRRWVSDRRVPVARTLEPTVEHALGLIPRGAIREGPEREVPLLVWNTDWFQAWYRALQAAGNQLVEVKSVWTFRVGPGRRRVVFWGLNPRIWIAAENRTMSSEVVIGRTDMSALMLYLPKEDEYDTDIVVVRDFRPAARTSDGYVWELPSGSGDSDDPKLTGLFEFEEETGLPIDHGRLRYHGARQVWATAAAHVAHVYSAEASPDEIAYLQGQQARGIAYGLHQQEEYTFPLVMTWSEILASPNVDWATKGMIAQVLCEGR